MLDRACSLGGQPWVRPRVGLISILNHFWADLRFWCLPCTPPLVAGICLVYVDVNAITLNCFNGLSVPLTTQLCITPKLLCEVTHIPFQRSVGPGPHAQFTVVRRSTSVFLCPRLLAVVMPVRGWTVGYGHGMYSSCWTTGPSPGSPSLAALRLLWSWHPLS